ncbi:MAG: methionyl-tRNA formyltransferase [Melioribacteraceae bacterium]|nr:methionyl-tRNA formyltransferase [Melioribacteraceae bacterium]MCF8265293.1 methionyl-tRNA formyltransferase [Melioribacteraceae bacterium]MCF8412552.1 methionyl-tRNA formyltransferase [Melioribacteraceae bacterium]
MKIIFFGTPDFAVFSLDALYKSEHEIVAVVTAPDKERGRGRKVTATAVKEFASAKNIPVLQPYDLKDESFCNDLSKFHADLFVVVAFKILPEKVFLTPPKGTFNLHGSLLPKYRGAAPIQWALINGDNETGLTTFFLKRKVDTGNILLQKKIAIDPEENFESLHDRMAEIGARLVLETCEQIQSGNITEHAQDDSKASAAPKITKEICQLDFGNSAEEVHNLIRGLSPFPGAVARLGNKSYKIYKSKICAESDLKSNEVSQTKTSIYVGCADKNLEILEIQPEGRKRMKSDEFLRGYSLI